jgi:hypothetical protein
MKNISEDAHERFNLLNLNFQPINLINFEKLKLKCALSQWAQCYEKHDIKPNQFNALRLPDGIGQEFLDTI